MRKKIFLTAAIALFMLGYVCQAGAEVNIGVLAKDVPVEALKK
jgi:hypothetical protein